MLRVAPVCDQTPNWIVPFFYFNSNSIQHSSIIPKFKALAGSRSRTLGHQMPLTKPL
jgi:hypothetical protein